MAHLAEACAAPESPSIRLQPVQGLNVERHHAPAGGINVTRTGHARSRLHTLLGGLEGVSPELVAIALVYFVQGILGLAGLALTFYQKDDLKMTPAQVALASTVCWIPWTIKPLYGFISDSFPIHGMRRRPYLVLAGLGGTLSWLALAGIAKGPFVAVFLMVLANVSTAVSDVVADSIVVQLARDAPKGTDGSLQSLCWGMHACGSILTAYLSGWLVQKRGARFVFCVTALFPLIVCWASAFINEQKLEGHGTAAKTVEDDWQERGSPGKRPHAETLVQQRQRLLRNLRSFWAALRQPDILRPAAFLFLWQATPNAGSAMFFFKTNVLGFDPEFLGWVELVAAIARLFGVVLYNFVFKHMRLRLLLLWGALVGTALGLTPLMLVLGINRRMGISDRAFALVDTALLTAIAKVLMMPTLVLSARICPEGVEATLYASLMSLLNAGTATSDALGGLLTSAFGVTATNFTHLVALLVVCNAAGVLPLPLLGWVPAAADVGSEASARAAGDGYTDDEEHVPLTAAHTVEEQLGLQLAGSGAALNASRLQHHQNGQHGLPVSFAAAAH